MQCEKYVQTRFLHACGELEDPPEEFLAHVKTCKGCKREIDEVETVREVYRSEKPPEPLPYPLAAHRTSRLASFLAVAAALLFALTGIILIGTGAPSVTPTEAGGSPPSKAVVVSGVEIDEQIAEIRSELDSIDFSDDTF